MAGPTYNSSWRAERSSPDPRGEGLALQAHMSESEVCCCARLQANRDLCPGDVQPHNGPTLLARSSPTECPWAWPSDKQLC